MNAMVDALRLSTLRLDALWSVLSRWMRCAYPPYGWTRCGPFSRGGCAALGHPTAGRVVVRSLAVDALRLATLRLDVSQI